MTKHSVKPRPFQKSSFQANEIISIPKNDHSQNFTTTLKPNTFLFTLTKICDLAAQKIKPAHAILIEGKLMSIPLEKEFNINPPLVTQFHD